MQEFILTLVVFFVLFRILGETRGAKSPVKIFFFNHRSDAGRQQDSNINTHQHSSSKKKISKEEEGEYVDYEEIKDENPNQK